MRITFVAFLCLITTSAFSSEIRPGLTGENLRMQFIQTYNQVSGERLVAKMDDCMQGMFGEQWVCRFATADNKVLFFSMTDKKNAPTKKLSFSVLDDKMPELLNKYALPLARLAVPDADTKSFDDLSGKIDSMIAAAIAERKKKAIIVGDLQFAILRDLFGWSFDIRSAE